MAALVRIEHHIAGNDITRRRFPVDTVWASSKHDPGDCSLLRMRYWLLSCTLRALTLHRLWIGLGGTALLQCGSLHGRAELGTYLFGSKLHHVYRKYDVSRN